MVVLDIEFVVLEGVDSVDVELVLEDEVNEVLATA